MLKIIHCILFLTWEHLLVENDWVSWLRIMDIPFISLMHRCMVENYGYSLSFIMIHLSIWLRIMDILFLSYKHIDAWLRIMDIFFHSFKHRCMVENYGHSLFHRCFPILVWTCRSATCLPPLPVLDSVILVWLEVAGTVRESDKEAVTMHCHMMYSLLLSTVLPHGGFFWIMRVNRL